MEKSQQGQRRSARIREKAEKSTKEQKRPPAPKKQPKAKPAGRKRKREAEAEAQATGAEAEAEPEPSPPKSRKTGPNRQSRPRPAEPIYDIELESVERAPHRDKHASILHWIHNDIWPVALFQADPGRYMEDLVSTTYATTTQRTENADPTINEMDNFLNSRGSFLGDHKDLIVKTEMALCGKLLKKDCEVPRDTMFEDDGSFEYVRRILPERNEVAVAQVIGRLIVPWAEIGIVRRSIGFKCLIDSIKEIWDGSVSLDETVHGQQLDADTRKSGQYQMPTPQPDYSVGFLKEAFNKKQLEKLAPFLGRFHSTSPFKGTVDMLFPFLTTEVKCSRVSIELADRQNAHSMTRALRGVVDLFRLVNREKELNRRILGFSVSHDHDSVRIYGHYPVTDQGKTTYYRHRLRAFSITERHGKERWTSHKFVMALYNDWVPVHFERLSSAVDDLPVGVNFDKVSSKSARSQHGSEIL